jgi:hypothetical protein
MTDTEMVYLTERIAVIHKGIEANHFVYMSFAPMTSSGQLVPPVPVSLIQERFNALEEYIVPIQCYIKLRGRNAVDDIPSEGENGLEWLREFQKVFNGVKKQFARLRQDVIVWHLTLLLACGKDVRSNKVFYKRFGKLLSASVTIVFQELAAPGTEEFWWNCVKERMAKYETLRPMERLIPDAGSLSEEKLVSRVADLFFINLQRWDRIHGMDIPTTYSIMRYFAFEFETKFRLGIFDIYPALSKKKI